ncbi:MAG: ribosomal protein L7/L12 [Hydrogenophilales bacterium]|nr:ribosomal protein L7/L12 [Hydrogenophilales bacterium]
MASEPTSEQLALIHNAIYAGNKIEAIKLYRTVTGKDLKDSKDAVDKLAAELEAGNPAMFAKRLRQSGSLATLVFWGAVAAAIAYFVFTLG